MSALLTLLNPITTTYSISLNSITNKFTLTNTSSFTINGSSTTISEIMGLEKIKIIHKHHWHVLILAILMVYNQLILILKI